VDAIEGFNRDVEPFAVDAIHPIMGEHEKYKPPHQQSDIHYGAPGQNFSCYFNCHGSSSFMILLHNFLKTDKQNQSASFYEKNL
jgi:hypothetical protein